MSVLGRTAVRGIAAATLATVLCGMAASAAPKPKPKLRMKDQGQSWRGELSGAVLVSDGDAGFQIGYGPYVLSELEFPIEGTLAEARASGAMLFPAGKGLGGAGLRGRYAWSLDVSGVSTDSDWDFSGERWGFTESDSEADVRIWDVDLVGFVQPFRHRGKNVSRPLELGAFVGYGTHAFDFEDRNLRGAYYGEPVAEQGPVSTYDVEFTGARVGSYLSVAPAQRLFVALEAALIPYLEAESDAYWILRDYPFSQYAEGMGMLLSAELRFRAAARLELLAGLRYVDLNADTDGIESGVSETGPYFDEPIVPEITAQYTALSLGAAFTF